MSTSKKKPAASPSRTGAARKAAPATRAAAGTTRRPTKAPRKAAAADAPGGAAVDALLTALAHPLAAEIAATRAAILAAAPGAAELVMWNAPSFRRGDDVFATIHVRETKRVLIVLHRGAKAGEKARPEPKLPDPLGLVERKGADRSLVRLAPGAGFAAALDAFRAIVRAWIGG